MAEASIVIVTYGKRAVTEKCLQSLARALGDDLGTRYELVLVDNNSPDDTLKLLRQWADRGQLIALPKNRNFAGGCNAGAKAANGEVLVFLNNDTEVPQGALEVLVDQAREPGVGIVGPRLLYPNGRIQHGGVVFREDAGYAWPLHLFHHENGELPAARATFDLDATTGACLVIGSDLFQSLGGFDEEYVNGLEDVDLCVRARIADKRIVYRGDVAIIHHERLTRGAGHDEKANATVFFSRWNETCGDDGDLLQRTLGAHWNDRLGYTTHPHDDYDGTSLVFGGDALTLAPEAAELRALLGVAGESGLLPALRDAPHRLTAIFARLDISMRALLDAARDTVASPDALVIHAPPAGRWQPGTAGALVRLGDVPPCISTDWRAMLVPSEAARLRLIAAGADPERVDVLPPPVIAAKVGGGGGGVLVLLPGHDLERCAQILAAVDGVVPVGFLPNVRTAQLDELVASRMPGAEVLAPTSCELEFAERAGRYDVVVCAGEDDPFDRRTLTAAACGTAVVARAGGPAAELLAGTPGAAGDAIDVSELRAALERALADGTARDERSARVLKVCSPQVLGPRLAEIVERRRPSADGYSADELAVRSLVS